MVYQASAMLPFPFHHGARVHIPYDHKPGQGTRTLTVGGSCTSRIEQVLNSDIKFAVNDNSSRGTFAIKGVFSGHFW
jgi:hypothetical protein